MARSRQVIVAALNVVTHPHSEVNYIQLIKDMFELKQAIAVYGEQKMLISSLDLSNERDGIIIGSIAKFTEISADLPWFNQNTLTVAEQDDVLNINIPEGLKPNYVAFLFYFDAKSHTIVFEQHLSSFSVSPNSVYKLFVALAARKEIVERYGHVEVTQIQNREALSEVFGLYQIREIVIIVNRPNPDDFSSYDEDVQRRLGDMNANTLQVVLKTDRSQSIVPDESTRALAEVATRNGVAVAHGSDAEGAPQTTSTRSHPLLMPYPFRSDHPSLGKTDMAGAARKVIDFILRRPT